VRGTQRASPDDWAAVAAALAPGLLRLAVMLTGSPHDAEDLLQVTFERAERHGPRIAAMAAPAAYLRRTMLNAHIKQSQRRQLPTVPISAAVAVPSAGPVDADDELWSSLASLPRQQRAALVLRYYEDLPVAEIAPLIGCSPATARSHISRGLGALRALISHTEAP
jgi:RNA polymerase sigma factor (sigma-70 family)